MSEILLKSLQFPGSDDTYKIPSTAADIGAAPSGYGLGEIGAVHASNNDANNAVRNGWYYAGTNVPTAGYWLIRVDSFDSGYTKQTAYAITNNSSIDTNCICRRAMERNAWTEWEWENPPLTLGTEYRTTARHDGKAVYTKFVSFGNLPNKSEKGMTLFPAGADVLEWQGYAIGSYTYPIAAPYVSSILIIRGSGSMYLTTTSDLSSYTGYFVFKYTKS